MTSGKSPGQLIIRSSPGSFRSGPPLGTPMPDFTLPDHLGRPVRFSASRTGRPALVHFFRSVVW